MIKKINLTNFLKNSTALILAVFAMSSCTFKGNFAAIEAVINDGKIDDDLHKKSIITISDLQVSVSEGSVALLSVQLSEKLSHDTTIAITKSGGVTGINRFQDFPASVVIAAGSLSSTVTFKTVDDVNYEGTENFVIEFSSNDADVEMKDTVLNFEITDNDPFPEIQFSQASMTVNEGAGTVTVPVTISNFSGFPITIPITLSGTATDGVDYAVQTGTLVIPKGAASHSIVLNITDDAISEVAETVIVTIGTPIKATVGTQSSITINLQDNDAPLATFKLSSQSFSEGNGAVAAWHSGMESWSRRLPIHGLPSGSALTNFPVMVKLNSSRITYSHFKTGGADIRFKDKNGTDLSYEIETWNTSGDSIIWVKLPSYTTTFADNVIWMYYGNSAASAPASSTGTWLTSLLAVHHFATGFLDSTSNVNNLTNTGVTTTSGAVGTAGQFSGLTTYLKMPNAFLSSRTVGSVEGWFKTSSTDVPILAWTLDAYPTSPSSYVPNLYIGSDGKLRGEQWHGTTAPITSTITVNDNQWHYFALTFATNTQRLYLDGNLIGTLSGTITAYATTHSYVGAGFLNSWPSSSGGWRGFTGLIDEVRVYSTSLSADWVAANNLNVRDSLCVYSNVELQSATLALLEIDLSAAAAADVTIPLTYAGTATSGTDYVAGPASITIPAGQTIYNLYLQILKDTTTESNETIQVTMGTPTNATLGSPSVHTLTIQDSVASAPVATADTVTITNLSSVSISVLANDTDANGDALYVSAVSALTNSSGTVSVSGTSVIYTPNVDFPVTDSFTYTVSDETGLTATGTVTINFQIPFTWTGATNSNWSTGTNWVGGAVPGSSNTAYFNNACSTNCNPAISAGVSVGGMNMTSYYTGTIAVGANTFTLGSLGFRIKGGTFDGGSTTHSYGSGSALNILGGTFKATSGTTTLRGSISIAEATNFDANGGSWIQLAEGTTWGAPTATNVTFNNLKLYANYYMDMAIASGSSTNVTGTMTIGQSSVEYGGFAGGSFNLYGDVNLIDRGGRGTTIMNIVGTGNQTITGSGFGHLPSVVINKPSGTLYLVGEIVIDRDFTYTAGTVNAGTSTVRFRPQDGAVRAHRYNGISLYNVKYTTVNLNMDGNNTTLNVLGTLTLDNNNYSIINTTFNAYGNVVCGSATGGSTVYMRGTNNVTLNSTGTNSCNTIVIDKSSGASVTLTSNYYLNKTNQDLSVLQGILNMAGYNFTVNRNVSNSGTIQRGTSPSCGTLTYGGTYTGAATTCP